MDGKSAQSPSFIHQHNQGRGQQHPRALHFRFAWGGMSSCQAIMAAEILYLWNMVGLIAILDSVRSSYFFYILSLIPSFLARVLEQ
jgi:hypothetical protein